MFLQTQQKVSELLADHQLAQPTLIVRCRSGWLAHDPLPLSLVRATEASPSNQDRKVHQNTVEENLKKPIEASTNADVRP
jgi:hypothetical protein